MPQIMKRGLSGQAHRSDRRLPDLPVVVVAPQESAARGSAQHVVWADATLTGVFLGLFLGPLGLFLLLFVPNDNEVKVC